MANNAYDLDSNEANVKILRQVHEVRVDIAVLRDLLERHGVISALEFDAARKYIATKPEFKQVSDYLDAVQSKIQSYKNDPNAYLRDIFAAKMNGKM